MAGRTMTTAQAPNTRMAADGRKPDDETRDQLNRAFIRAEREDDDGYDPYSDRIEYEPLFERDPWS